MDQWIQTAAVVATGLYAIFRLGRYFQAQASDIKNLKGRVENHKERLDTIEQRCYERHRSKNA